MPVPVPHVSKPLAHPVVKKGNCGDYQNNPFQHLTRTLPISPTGPPPSFGTREQWINSLPSWRRTKPRRIWEDDTRIVEQCVEQGFYRGLTTAGNASVIEGAYIPPQYTLLEVPTLPCAEGVADFPQVSDGDADDEMSSDYSVMDHSHLDNQSQWSASSALGDDVDHLAVGDELRIQLTSSSGSIPAGAASYDPSYERGAFTPVFEDQSPGTASGHDAGSSPPEPITPFGEFVDRAVAAAQPHTASDNGFPDDVALPAYIFQDSISNPQCYQAGAAYQTVPEPPKEFVAAPEVVTPTATTGYKKLAEPLSRWVADYVWKVCTTGLSLPSMFSRPATNPSSHYASSPPSYLAMSIHSLLLSTLLQPSAVFLAIWYIVRLPVYFGAIGLAAVHVKENRFRSQLLGANHLGVDQEAMEASAPFRLTVLGCMLANKWLDDHTFSNKTWHTISSVPIHALNKLESLALDIFSYDLSVPTRDWSQWLAHVMSYHLALAPPSHPQPISRPSMNPHSIIRKAIEEIIQPPGPYNAPSVPQPVFIGLEMRRREKLENDHASAADILEIDLDEDGPLREEYLPRRRVSGAGSFRDPHTRNFHHVANPPVDSLNEWDRHNIEKSLPPPAKWSPAGDEPILRERNSVIGHYVAVQPPVHSVPYPPYQPHPVGYIHQSWNTADAYVPVKPQTSYVLDLPQIHAVGQLTYNPYPYAPQVTLSHSRSQSLSYDQDISQSRYHQRSYSQSRFEYRCSDIRMTANELAPPPEMDVHWIPASHYPYTAPTSLPGIGYQSTWLRA